jgi:WD40 repeat protein
MTSMLSPSSLTPKIQVLGEPQLHTDGEIATLTFAPDGTLWSVEEPGVLRHWNSESGQQLGWHSLSDLDTLWCFSGDARILASASDDLTLWDVSSGQSLTDIPQDSWVAALAFHPDPTFLATGHDDGVVRCWDVTGHQALHSLHHHKKPISALAYSADGARLAVASEDKTITLWDTKTGTLLGVLQGHTDRIPALAWHPSGQWLVSAGWDTTARVWDVAQLQPAILLNTHSGQVTALAFTRDGSLLACGDANLAVHVWDFTTKKTLHVLEGPQSEIRALAFSPDGGRLASSGDRVIHLWNPRSGQSQTGSAPRAGAKTSVAVSANGSTLASNGGGLAARVWNLASKKVVCTLDAPEAVHALAYTPDGRLVAGAVGNVVRLWDAATGKIHADWDGPEEPITTLAISPDGTTLASASSTGLPVWLWSVADGEPILLIPDALDGCTVEALAFHPDGQRLAVGGIDWLATGGSNGAIALWNLPGRYEEAACFDGATALAMHPQGKRLAFATLEQSIGIWDFASQELVDEFVGHDGMVAALAYSPDGKLLASGSEDRTLRLWSEAGDELALAELDSQITALVFSPDGQFLFTGNANTTCSVVKIADLLRKKS